MILSMFTKIRLVTVADRPPLPLGRGSSGFKGIPCVRADNQGKAQPAPVGYRPGLPGRLRFGGDS